MDEGEDKDRCPFRDGNFAFAQVCGTCRVSWQGTWREIFDEKADCSALYNVLAHVLLKLFFRVVQTQFLLNLKAKIEQFARGLDTQRTFSWMFLWTLMFVGQLIGENVILYA